MKRLMHRLEDIMVAVTFAEAGEFDTAEKLMVSKALDQEISMGETAALKVRSEILTES